MNINPTQQVRCDVAVIGAGIAGMFAAVAAARHNAKTLLLERHNVLGGNATAAGVCTFCGDTENVNHPWRDMLDQLKALDALNDYVPEYDGRSFDVNKAAFVFQEYILAQGVDLMLDCCVVDVDFADEKIHSVTAAGKSGLFTIYANNYIDCTGDADLIRFAGLDVLKGGPIYKPGDPPTLDANAEPLQLPASLHFTMVDTGKPVQAHLPENCPQWTNDTQLPMTTIYQTSPTEISVKMKVINADATDTHSISNAEIRAKRQMMALVHYLQTQGYAGQTYTTYALSSIAPQIGIREGARAIGEYILTDDDVKHGRHFNDAVAVGSYHIDYHWPNVLQRSGTGITATVPPYHIPLRSLIVKNVTNLATAGRSFSAQHLAFSSARVMATCAQTGFAAGAASAIASVNAVPLKNIDITQLKQFLNQQGQSLELARYGRYLRQMRSINEFIFDADRFFQSCHASTLAELPDGDVVTAWFAGTREGHGDVAIWQSIRHEGQWSDPKIVADITDMPHWNPVLFFDDDKIHLFYRTGKTIYEWRSFLIVSTDGGKTYSDPKLLPDTILGPIKNKPIRLSNGQWLCPSSKEMPHRWTCYMELYSPDQNLWQSVGPIEITGSGKGIIQPTVWESTPGNVHALMRSDQDVIYRTDSTDFGKSWSKPYATDLPNPNSGIDLAKLDDGTLVLAYNPTTDARSPLVLALSEDNGKTWPRQIVLEDQPGEYSYPSIIPVSSGVAVVYTWNRRRIRYQVVSPTQCE